MCLEQQCENPRTVRTKQHRLYYLGQFDCQPCQPCQSRLSVLETISRKPFGQRLARKVSEQLQKSESGLFNSHMYYCGHGLICDGGRFYLLEVYEGWPDPKNKRDVIAMWDSKEKFEDFLARQSDYTCSGAASICRSCFSTSCICSRRATRSASSGGSGSAVVPSSNSSSVLSLVSISASALSI